MEEMTKNLLDFSLEELEVLLAEMGQQKFRAKQIYQWVNRGIKEIDEMSNISKELRQALKEQVCLNKLSVEHKLVSKIDGTAKYLFRLSDGNIIESVLMEYKHGISACISSQIGCKMGCRFCASTGAGFIRNLTAGEMLDQILTMQTDAGKRIGNIVIMGIGEPMDNYTQVIKFLRLVNHPEGLNVGYRHISVSTCGLVPKILQLAKESLPVTLSVSLHASNDEAREKIMPINRSYSIDKLIEACKIYTEETNRRITFEYALIEGVNDSKSDAVELAHKIKGMLCHVNLIPVNAIKEGVYRKSSKQQIKVFQETLQRYGIEATVRRELGADIEAACGQLRRSVLDENAINAPVF